MAAWVKWKKPLMSLIELGTEDTKNVQDVDGITGDNYIRYEMPLNSLMTKFFKGSDINDLIQDMFAHIKTQVENPEIDR